MNTFSKYQIVVSLGSNCKQREDKLKQALDALQKEYGELCVSPVYESGADGSGVCHDGGTKPELLPPYLNMVASFFSEQSVEDIQCTHKRVERSCGRDRTEDTVAIDIDFLFYGNVDGEHDGVYFPRKNALGCAYVLRPLADIFPYYTHASLEKTFVELWRDLQTTQVLQPVEFVWGGQLISVGPTCLPI